MHKIGGAHLQCVNNHYAKFEYKGLNTVGVSTLHELGTPLAFMMEKMFKFNTRKKLEKKMKCAQNKRCTSSMCEQSLGKV